MPLYIVQRTHKYVVESENLEDAQGAVIACEGELIGNERGTHETSQLEELKSIHQIEDELADMEPVNGNEENPVKSFFS